ncbi:MAG TPA: mitofilin family membrane protein [Stellaceae bacterium]|nr:mitofilin family membrane protein [Stellaceae bacterium]
MSEQHGEESGPERPPGWTAPRTIDATQEDAPTPSGHGRQLWPVLALVVAVVAILGTAPYWTQYLPWSAPTESEAARTARQAQGRTLAKLQQQQAALGERVGTLEQQIKAAATPQWMEAEAAAMRALADRVVALEKRPQGASDAQQLAALTQAVQKLEAANAALGERLDRLEQHGAAAADTRNDEALLLALGQLRGAVEGGQGFAHALDTVKTLGRDRPELGAALAPLDASAADGVPSLMSLTQRFRQEVAPDLLRTPASAEDGSFGERLVAKLRSLVVIRRVGSSATGSGDPLSAAVAKAEAALASDDLASAVQAIEALPERQRAPAEAWLAAAQRRLTAEAALNQANALLAGRFSAAATPAAAETPKPH